MYKRQTPHNNPYATSVFQGLKSTTDRAAIIHASMEGVAFALKDGFDALIDAGGKCNTITVIGGGSRSRYWGKIIANCLDKTLIYRDGSDIGPAKGAALLAQSGMNNSKIETINEAAPIIEAIEPENNHVQKYKEKSRQAPWSTQIGMEGERGQKNISDEGRVSNVNSFESRHDVKSVETHPY